MIQTLWLCGLCPALISIFIDVLQRMFLPNIKSTCRSERELAHLFQGDLWGSSMWVFSCWNYFFFVFFNLCGSSAVVIFHSFLQVIPVEISSWVHFFKCFSWSFEVWGCRGRQVAVAQDLTVFLTSITPLRFRGKPCRCSTMSITITMVGGKQEWEILTHTLSRFTRGIGKPGDSEDGFLEFGNGKYGGEKLDGL